jgi:steroid delta-isomerase-like uncharacterized protein
MQETPDGMVRRWFEELWNQGREETIDSLLAPGAKVHGLATPDGRPISGPEEFRPFFRRFRQAFPDIRVDVVRTVTEGDVVVAQCRVTGTHLGDALGVPASRRPVEFWGMCMIRVADGRFVEGWNSFDFLACYQQMGVLPQLGPPAAS